MSSWNNIKSQINSGYQQAKNYGSYYGNKTRSGAKSGGRAVLNDYGLSDALNSTAQAHAKGYNTAVKTGLMTGSKAGKLVAGKVIPGVGWAMTIKDGYTFVKGFTNGWNAYGR